MCHVVALIEVQRFRIVTHGYAASFSTKLIYVKLETFFILSNMTFHKKLVMLFESSLKIKVTSQSTLFQIMLTPAVILI